MDEMRVTKVPAAFVMPKIKNVGVYCRVSTRSMEQLHSLASQVSHFTQLIRRRRDWKLYDFYIDIASGADLDNRPEFRRMMNDCENGVVNTVITKSISRFGRNTEQALISLRLLKAYYVEVIFESEAVRFIFESYLNGASLNMIQDQLRQRGILSPTGKDTWCKQSVNMLLSNEKYCGDVLLMKSVNLGGIEIGRAHV